MTDQSHIKSYRAVSGWTHTRIWAQWAYKPPSKRIQWFRLSPRKHMHAKHIAHGACMYMPTGAREIEKSRAARALLNNKWPALSDGLRSFRICATIFPLCTGPAAVRARYFATINELDAAAAASRRSRPFLTFYPVWYLVLFSKLSLFV